MEDQSIDRKVAFDYAWAWFSLHADQRMKLVNFWLVAVAFITAGIVQAFASGEPKLAAAAAVGGTFVTCCFQQLEQRTRQLVTIGERALMQFEDEMAVAFDLDDLRLKAAAEKRETSELSGDRSMSSFRYRDVIRILHLGVAALFLAGAVYGLSIASWR